MIGLVRSITSHHITSESLVNASRLIKKGKIFDLSIPLGASGPAIGGGGRMNPIHLMGITPSDTHILKHILTPPDMLVADDWITMPLHDDRIFTDYDRARVTATIVSWVNSA